MNRKAVTASATSPTPTRSVGRSWGSILLFVGAMAFLGWRVYATLTRPKPGLKLGENVTLTPPPPLLPDDRVDLLQRLQSLEPLRKEVQANPQEAPSQLRLAATAMRAGDMLVARSAFQAALRQKPSADPDLNHAFGRCLLQLGQYAEAEKVYQQVIAHTPQSSVGYVGKHTALLSLQRREEALQTLAAGRTALSANDLAGRVSLIAAQEAQEGIGPALTQAQALLTAHPHEIPLQVLVAQLLFKQGKVQEAQPLLEKILSARPDNNTARTYLAAVLDSPLMPQRDRARAESLLLETIERDPYNETAHTRLAELYTDQQRPKEAALIYLRILAMRPDRAAARLGLSQAYAALGDSSSAQEQQRLAQVLLTQEQEEQRILTRRDQRPTDPDLRLELARFYLQRRRYGKAFTELQTAYALDPQNALSRRELTALYRDAKVNPPFAEEKP